MFKRLGRVIGTAMALPLPPEWRYQELQAETTSLAAKFGANYSPAAPTTEPEEWLSHRRAQVRSSLLEARYEHIVQRRLSLIPERLPFLVNDIVNRLKENDEESPFHNEQSKLLELETDRVLLEYNVLHQTRDAAQKRDRLRRRLDDIWEYLVVQAKFIDGIGSHRQARFGHNIHLFLRSDIPSSYLIDMGQSTQWEVGAQAVVLRAEGKRLAGLLTGRSAEKVSRSEFLGAKPSLQKIDEAFRQYVQKVGTMMQLSDTIMEWRDAFEYYVDLFTARGLPEFRQSHPISFDSLNPETIRRLSSGLQGATKNVRRTLVRDYPRELSAVHWLPDDDPFATGFLRLELETT